MSEKREPWAFVASIGGVFHGVSFARLEDRDLSDWYADMAGCDIVTVYSREEYDAKLRELEHLRT